MREHILGTEEWRDMRTSEARWYVCACKMCVCVCRKYWTVSPFSPITLDNKIVFFVIYCEIVFSEVSPSSVIYDVIFLGEG